MSVITLTQLDPDLIAAGGKARSLARMLQLKMPVPAGFVILPSAFNGDVLNDASRRQVETIVAQLWPNPTHQTFAVRSSGTAEDSPHSSFAGEFETLLNIEATDLFNAVEAIYRSRHSERVEAYRQEQGITKINLAIVVQEMIPADLAGVLFTADPITGRLAEMPGSAILGLGEALVSGEQSGMPFKLVRPRGGIIADSPIPHLTSRMGRELLRHATRLEEQNGSAQDIEWAIAHGKLFLLQARPVTTLQGYDARTGDYNSSKQGEYLWTNSNFGEAIPDVMTPATWSIVEIFMQETIPFDFLDAHPIMGNIGGRFYMNMSIMASLFMALGFSRERLNQESEEFFGSLPEDMEIPILPMRFFPTARRFVPAAIGQIRRVLKRRAQVATFTPQIPAKVALIGDKIAAASEPADLLPIWRDELLPLYRYVSQLLQAATSNYENRYRKLRGQLLKLTDADTADTLLTGLNSQDGELASLGPLLGLSRLQRGEISRAEFSQRYGHRSPHEYELSKPRPYEDPDWITAQLAHLERIDPQDLLDRQAANRTQAWQSFSGCQSWSISSYRQSVGGGSHRRPFARKYPLGNGAHI